jgi:hypothetical protein
MIHIEAGDGAPAVWARRVLARPGFARRGERCVTQFPGAGRGDAHCCKDAGLPPAAGMAGFKQQPTSPCNSTSALSPLGDLMKRRSYQFSAK